MKCPSLITIALCGAAVACAACSHEQTPPPAAPVKTAAAPRAPRREARAQERPQIAEQDMNAGKGAKENEIYFDFDSSLLRDDSRPVLQKVASAARAQDAAVRIEGNCDELGTTEYNLALGDQRARQAKDYLVRLGVPPARIETVSYGSQHPKDPGHDETARAHNRRDDLILK